MTKKLIFFVFTAVLLVMVAGCAPNGQINVPATSVQIYAPGANPQVNTADAHGRVAGFFQGIWHGIISPVTLVMSLINKTVQMYEVHNNGSPYNFGFLLGVAIVFIILGALLGSRR